MRIHDVLIKPIVTEKASMASKSPRYVFEVSLDANKDQIKTAISKMFHVEVDAVRTVVTKGKMKRVGRKGKLKARPDVKKAYITLAKGTIDIAPKA